MPLYDIQAGSFILDLTEKDYQILYKITLNVYRKQHPGKPDPDARTVNGMMNEAGPRTAEMLIRRAVDAKAI
tara:strand:- start:1699 stop:1914 length:216 start_codon:yes stop_codon:yes gene_type:complete